MMNNDKIIISNKIAYIFLFCTKLNHFIWYYFDNKKTINYYFHGN